MAAAAREVMVVVLGLPVASLPACGPPDARAALVDAEYAAALAAIPDGPG